MPKMPNLFGYLCLLELRGDLYASPWERFAPRGGGLRVIEPTNPALQDLGSDAKRCRSLFYLFWEFLLADQ